MSSNTMYEQYYNYSALRHVAQKASIWPSAHPLETCRVIAVFFLISVTYCFLLEENKIDPIISVILPHSLSVWASYLLLQPIFLHWWQSKLWARYLITGQLELDGINLPLRNLPTFAWNKCSNLLVLLLKPKTTLQRLWHGNWSPNTPVKSQIYAQNSEPVPSRYCLARLIVSGNIHVT